MNHFLCSISVFVIITLVNVANVSAANFVGDIDGNETLDLVDTIKILQVLSGNDSSDPIDLLSADVNDDDTIGIAEAVYSLNAQQYPWTAEYYNNIDLTGLAIKQKEPIIAHNWGSGIPAESIGPDTFSVRWSGTFDFDGIYEFVARSDDGIRVWLGENQVMDHWIDVTSTTYAEKREINGTHDVVVEYFENTDAAMVEFSWDTYLSCECDQNDNCEIDCACDLDCDGLAATPTEIDDILINPGMGMSDFHFRWWCNLPPVTFTPEQCNTRWNSDHDNWPENYPAAGSAYFRWHWKDIEPEQGKFNWDLIDTTIQSANLLGETLAIRIMTIDDSNGRGLPDWLNVPGETINGIFWPDYRNETYLAAHKSMVEAVAARYDNHPGLDHVDIGAVGCWGEWNTACLSNAGGLFEIFNPQNEADYQVIANAYKQLIDHYADAFEDTPLVMLGIDGDHEIGVMKHAMERGAGWRVDCWGDWWNFSPNWSHMDDLYPNMIANMTAAYPDFPNVYRHAPIELEICGSMPGWYNDQGYSATVEVANSFQWAVDQHASLLNFKSTNIHVDYVDALNDLLKQNGYRYVIDQFSQPGTASAGDKIFLSSNWRNMGVAPNYNRRYLTYRLRSNDTQELFESSVDTRQWQPGSFEVNDMITLPADLPSGTYFIDVGLLDKAAVNPAWAPLPPIHLAIEGRMDDGWYALSQITVE